MTKIKFYTNNQRWLIIFTCLSLLFLVTTSSGCKGKEKEKVADNATPGITSGHKSNSTVAEYIDYVKNDKNKMTLDHAYTNEALLKLTSAISATAKETDFDIKGDLEKARECANNITQNPFETTHADEIRKAADILSGVMHNMQVAKYPGLTNEIGELKSAVAAINPRTLTLDQQDQVKLFFSKAADLLEKMNY